MTVTIITNNQPRLTLNWNQLTPAEQSLFDYAKGREAEMDFVRYKGNIYDLSEFMLNTLIPQVWDGVKAETFFSGILFRFDRTDTDYVVMGRYYE